MTEAIPTTTTTPTPSQLLTSLAALSRSPHAVDLTTAASRFCQAICDASPSSARGHLLAHGLPLLARLLRCGVDEAMMYAARSVAIISSLPELSLVVPELARVVAKPLCELVHVKTSASVLEAVLASLMHLSRQRCVVDEMEETGAIGALMPVLAVAPASVQANALALVAELVEHERHLECLLRLGVVAVLKDLRRNGADDVFSNAEIVWTKLPLPAEGSKEEEAVEEVIERLGIMLVEPRRVRLAMHKMRGCYDSNTIMTWVLDHDETPEEEAEYQRTMDLIRDCRREQEEAHERKRSRARTDEMLLSSDVPSKPQHRRKAQSSGAAPSGRSADDNKIAAIVEMGFSAEEAHSALMKFDTVTSAVHWLCLTEEEQQQQAHAQPESAHDSTIEFEAQNEPSAFDWRRVGPGQWRPRDGSGDLTSPSPSPLLSSEEEDDDSDELPPPTVRRTPPSVSQTAPPLFAPEPPTFDLSGVDEALQEVVIWLRQNRLGRYSEVFVRNQVDMDLLPHMLERIHELIDMPGDQVRFKRAIERQFGPSNAVPSTPPLSGLSGSSSSSLQRRSSAHFGFLHTLPLKDSEQPGVYQKIDMAKERSALINMFDDTKTSFRVRFAVATIDTFLSMVARGVRVMHISGHGHPEYLVLENGEGGITPLRTEKLSRTLADGGNVDLKLAFVSTCYSAFAAQVLYEAGVPHVICVDGFTKITDVAAQVFARHLYQALCAGETVRRAFKLARRAVSAQEPDVPNAAACCCVHLHEDDCTKCDECGFQVCCPVHGIERRCHKVRGCCRPVLPHCEAEKFHLLPRDGNHDVPLFVHEDDEVALQEAGDDVCFMPPPGAWVDLSVRPPKSNVPAPPQHFAGRAQTAYEIVGSVLKNRIATVSGAPGIGKSALARFVGKYCNDRRKYRDGVFYVDARCHTILELAHKLLDVLLEFFPVNTERTGSPASSSGSSPSSSSSSSSSSLPAGAMSAPPAVRHISSPAQAIRRLSSMLRSKQVLLILDNADHLTSDKQPELSQEFRSFLRRIVDHNERVSVLVTCRTPIGGIDGVTNRHHMVRPLHALDGAALFINRLPRSLNKQDFGDSRPTTLAALLRHPLFQMIHANPRVLENCASALTHLSLPALCQRLQQRDDQWPDTLDVRIRQLLKEVQVMCLRYQRELQIQMRQRLQQQQRPQ